VSPPVDGGPNRVIILPKVTIFLRYYLDSSTCTLHSTRGDSSDVMQSIRGIPCVTDFPKTNNELELSRVILDPKNPEIDSSHLVSINPARAIALIQLHQRNADRPEKFANILLGIYNAISGRPHGPYTVKNLNPIVFNPKR